MSPATTLDRPSLERIAAIIRCLGHPLRLRLLQAMGEGQRSVSELQECTGEAQATVSRQLAVLRARGVVAAERDGVNVYYRIVEPRVHPILECIADVEPGPD
jgi:DNA-binding transcriptional ArsR family regulator